MIRLYATQIQVKAAQQDLNFFRVVTLQEGMPGVSIILPVQEYRAYSLLNWQSQLSMRYAGPVEYIFVAQTAAGLMLKVALQSHFDNSAACCCIHSSASNAGPVENVFVAQTASRLMLRLALQSHVDNSSACCCKHSACHMLGLYSTSLLHSLHQVSK